LGSPIENAGTLVLVLIVDLDFSGRQIVGDALVVIDFTESKQTVGNKASFAARVCGNETDKHATGIARQVSLHTK
jgi:hypothetical protein